MKFQNVVELLENLLCQSWSEAGAMRGIKDKRGQLLL